MARTAIAVADSTTSNPPRIQLVTNASDIANGNMFINDGRTILILNNNTGGNLTVTITSIADRFGRVDSAFTNLTIFAGALQILGPFPKAVWDQTGADLGNVYVNTSATTLQVGAFRLAVTGASY